MDPSPKTIELLHYPGQWNLELTGSCYSTVDAICDLFSERTTSRSRSNVQVPCTIHRPCDLERQQPEKQALLYKHAKGS